MKIVADVDLPFVQDYFGPYGELLLKPGRLIQREDLKDADLLLVRSVTRVDEQLLHHTSVKCVGSMTTGVDHLDTAWLDQAGIVWRDTAGYNAAAVADYVMAVMAATCATAEESVLPRVGIVGVGHVGSQVAERFKRLGCSVLLCDPPRAEREKAFAALPLSSLTEVDLLSLHTPLTMDGKYPTHHLINQAFLSKTKAKGLLINTARGAVVDSTALKASQTPWDYGFDVWENEPELDLSVLQNAWIATPHLAGHSVQTRYRGMALLYEALCAAQVIQPKSLSFPSPPRHRLAFDGRQLSWQEIVLAIFNPLPVTAAMQVLLLKEPQKCATLFDKLRQQYIGKAIKRHEFSYTTVFDVQLTERDRDVLTQFGINFEE